MELPQIVTDINGANEIIKDKWNGLIIPPHRVDDIWNAMKQLMSDEKLRRIMSNNARKMVAERFEQKYLWGELLKVYKNLTE